jgi:SAM-dependent methyltransferase
MKAAIPSYTAQRTDPRTFFSYGLHRRFKEIRDEFRSWHSISDSSSVTATIADLGCADGAMLDALCDAFPNSIERAIGVDLFRGGFPNQVRSSNIEMVQHHLAKDFPYPFEAESVDFAIVSAYLKHHPSPASFLRELQRILKPNGRAVLLDPVPLVVRLGVLLRYFDPKYTMSPWSAQTLKGMFDREGLRLRIRSKRRYWIAPSRKMFEMGIENALPAFVRNRIGVHQCVVVTRTSE